MKDFSKESINFIVRAKENRKHVEIENLITETDYPEFTLLKDSKVYLYTGIHINKSEKKYYNEELVNKPFRLIVIQSKRESEKQYWFISNNFDLSPQEIARAYKRRWDIEVFFRFIKQELNVSHLVSMNKNGIEVMLYMTLIVAILVLIYKHANRIGYKTAKRRFTLEVRNLIIAMIVVQCGGDPNPNIFFKSKKE